VPSLSGKIGGGSISADRNFYNLDTSDATAVAGDILLSKTAYADGDKLTGTLILDGNATPGDVLSGKTFYSNNLTKRTGAVTELLATTYTPTITDQYIQPKQYCSGTQTILGDSNLTADNIKDGVTIFGVEGTADLIENGVSYINIDVDEEITSAIIYGSKVVGFICDSQPHLATVVLPIGLQEIEGRAFSYCPLLDFDSLPDTLLKIGLNAFAHCTSLSLTQLPSNLTTILNTAFDGCSSLNISTLPSNIKRTYSGCFRDCTSITSMTLPNGLTKIDFSTFRGCTGLTKIWIPASCAEIIATGFGSNIPLYSPFYECNSTLHIYCEVASKPSGWQSYWRYYNDTSELSVTWNTTLAEFNAL